MLNDINPFATEEITPAFNDEWVAKRRVANAIRQLTEVLVTSSPSTEKMHAIAEQLELTAEEFGGASRIYGRFDWARSGEHGNFGQVSHELNPMAGWSNPIAPPINNWIDGDMALGTCQCGWAYEGPPGQRARRFCGRHLRPVPGHGASSRRAARNDRLPPYQLPPTNTTQYRVEAGRKADQGRKAQNHYARRNVCGGRYDGQCRRPLRTTQGWHALCENTDGGNSRAGRRVIPASIKGHACNDGTRFSPAGRHVPVPAWPAGCTTMK